MEFHFAGRNMPGYFEKYESNGVECAGEVENSDAFVEGKGVLIVPLKSGGGIRIKVLEGMALGKLVICTSIGMQGIESALPGIHYLKAETKEDFIDTIQWVLVNKEAALRIAEEGRKMVEQEYDKRRIIAGLMKVLDEKLEGN